MRHSKILLGLIGAGLGLCVATAASAQTSPKAKPHRHYRPVVTYYDSRPPLMVNRRSFLDPGPVVPVGSLSNYVAASTVFGRTSDQNYARSLYGNEALPAPLEVPGRPSPLFNFDTPGYRY